MQQTESIQEKRLSPNWVSVESCHVIGIMLARVVLYRLVQRVMSERKCRKFCTERGEKRSRCLSIIEHFQRSAG